MKVLSAEYLLLVLCALAGFGGVSAAFAVSVGTSGLLTRSWPKYLSLWRRAREVDKLGALGLTMGVSLLNALVAVAASYGMGFGLQLLAAW